MSKHRLVSSTILEVFSHNFDKSVPFPARTTALLASSLLVLPSPPY